MSGSLISRLCDAGVVGVVNATPGHEWVISSITQPTEFIHSNFNGDSFELDAPIANAVIIVPNPVPAQVLGIIRNDGIYYRVFG